MSRGGKERLRILREALDGSTGKVHGTELPRQTSREGVAVERRTAQTERSIRLLPKSI